MPKIKTHSGAKKRFKLSKNGKPMRGHAYKSHILTKKTAKMKRRLRKPSTVGSALLRQTRKMLPYL